MTTEREIADRLAIATSTLYSPEDVVRPPLALGMVRDALERGYDVVVADHGSPDTFLKELGRTGATVIATTGTMGSQRRQAMQKASELESIVAWLEPEKQSYIPELWKTGVPILEGNADIVVPSRQNLAGYPPVQKGVEYAGNALWKALTGTDLDVWFGPRTFNADRTHYFTQYDGRHGDRWEGIFVPLVEAIADGNRVLDVPVEYAHPTQQTLQESLDPRFIAKRLSQLYIISRAVDAAVREST